MGQTKIIETKRGTHAARMGLQVDVDPHMARQVVPLGRARRAATPIALETQRARRLAPDVRARDVRVELLRVDERQRTLCARGDPPALVHDDRFAHGGVRRGGRSLAVGAVVMRLGGVVARVVVDGRAGDWHGVVVVVVGRRWQLCTHLLSGSGLVRR